MDKREAYRVILLLGVVSLLGDVVYEGSRGTIPEYFRYLGASAAVGDLTDPSVRATAYGFFGGALGLGAMAAGYLYGLMVDLNAPPWLGSLYVIATQAASLALPLYVVKTR